MINEKLTAFNAEISMVPLYFSDSHKVEILNNHGLSYKLDESGATIGKRYARTDEIGIPFAITIDYTTVEDRTVTLRERDSTRQIRVPVLIHDISTHPLDLGNRIHPSGTN